MIFLGNNGVYPLMQSVKRNEHQKPTYFLKQMNIVRVTPGEGRDSQRNNEEDRKTIRLLFYETWILSPFPSKTMETDQREFAMRPIKGK